MDFILQKNQQTHEFTGKGSLIQCKQSPEHAAPGTPDWRAGPAQDWIWHLQRQLPGAPYALTFQVATRLGQSPALRQQRCMGHRHPHCAAFFAGFILKDFKKKKLHYVMFWEATTERMEAGGF